MTEQQNIEYELHPIIASKLRQLHHFNFETKLKVFRNGGYGG